ncbi:MAG: DinB family protein [Planctomycetota bacterium]
MALEQEVKIYQFLLGYGEMLLADIADDDAYKLICEGGVSPAWIIGHLGFVANRILGMCGGDSRVDTDAWQPLFGGGSKPAGDADRERYPAWDELKNTWRQGHADLAAIAPAVSAEQLSQPNPNEQIAQALPTIEDFLGFVLASHDAIHLGQLSTWRRVQGRPPLF